MTTSPAVYLKAIVAFAIATVGAATVAAGGPDLGSLSIGEWLGALGAGLVSGGAVFGTPNKSADPVLSAPEVVANSVAVVIEARAQAQKDLDKVTEILGGVAGQLPIYGDEAKALIEGLRF